MTNTKFGKYEFEKINKLGDREAILLKVYNNNAKKEYNRTLEYVRFGTTEERQKYIDNYISRVKSWEDMKAERKQARKDFKNPAKIGDLLCASWGYDQTNIDFYQVTQVKGKMVEVREIGGHSVEGSGQSHGMADQVKVVKDSFVKDSEPISRLVKQSAYGDYYINVDQVRSAFKTDESEKHYRSWYA